MCSISGADVGEGICHIECNEAPVGCRGSLQSGRYSLRSASRSGVLWRIARLASNCRTDRIRCAGPAAQASRVRQRRVDGVAHDLHRTIGLDMLERIAHATADVPIQRASLPARRVTCTWTACATGRAVVAASRKARNRAWDRMCCRRRAPAGRAARSSCASKSLCFARSSCAPRRPCGKRVAIKLRRLWPPGSRSNFRRDWTAKGETQS